jgi:hypothetical protein
VTAGATLGFAFTELNPIALLVGGAVVLLVAG